MFQPFLRFYCTPDTRSANISWLILFQPFLRFYGGKRLAVNREMARRWLLQWLVSTLLEILQP